MVVPPPGRELVLVDLHGGVPRGLKNEGSSMKAGMVARHGPRNLVSNPDLNLRVTTIAQPWSILRGCAIV